VTGRWDCPDEGRFERARYLAWPKKFGQGATAEVVQIPRRDETRQLVRAAVSASVVELGFDGQLLIAGRQPIDSRGHAPQVTGPVIDNPVCIVPWEADIDRGSSEIDADKLQAAGSGLDQVHASEGPARWSLGDRTPTDLDPVQDTGEGAVHKVAPPNVGTAAELRVAEADAFETDVGCRATQVSLGQVHVLPASALRPEPRWAAELAVEQRASPYRGCGDGHAPAAQPFQVRVVEHAVADGQPHPAHLAQVRADQIQAPPTRPGVQPDIAGTVLVANTDTARSASPAGDDPRQRKPAKIYSASDVAETLPGTGLPASNSAPILRTTAGSSPHQRSRHPRNNSARPIPHPPPRSAKRRRPTLVIDPSTPTYHDLANQQGPDVPVGTPGQRAFRLTSAMPDHGADGIADRRRALEPG
jgi:hypothetical protein